MREKWMAPEWLACPEIPQYSIGWRMGYGEDYGSRLGTWSATLSEEEGHEWARLFPMPVFWDDESIMGDEDSAPDLYYERDDYFLRHWRPNGQPAYDRAWLEAEAAGKNLKYVHFWGHTPEKDGHITQTCLSQWWMAQFKVDGRPYCCMEQFMMAEKARLFGDKETLEKIMEATVQGKIKALGREVKHFDQEEWDKCKHTIVLTGNFQKFLQNPELKDFLLRTGDKILVEASPRDRIWGIGMGASNENAANPAAWRGQNRLGFALMEVRDELRRVCANEDKIDWEISQT
ncbi:MAG: NADAR family protein [Lawsonibacter sp.]|nr:NADAR family protein [Lawsonibacter sp.]